MAYQRLAFEHKNEVIGKLQADVKRLTVDNAELKALVGVLQRGITDLYKQAFATPAQALAEAQQEGEK